MVNFNIARVLDGGAFGQPVTTAEIRFDPEQEQFVLFDYGQETTHSLSVNGSGQIQLSGTTDHSSQRINLPGNGASGTVLQADLDRILASSNSEAQSAQTLYLSPDAWSGNAARAVATDLNGATYLYVSELTDVGVSAYRMQGNSPQFVAQIEGPTGGYGAALAGLAAIEIGGSTFLFTGSSTQNGIDSYRLNSSGIPQAVQSVGVQQLLPVQSVSAITTVQIDGSPYLLVAAAGSSSLSVLSIAGNGQLDVTDHIIDTQDTRFAGVTRLETFEVSGRIFVLAAGSDDGLSLLELLPSGHLVHLDSIEDTVNASLGNMSAFSVQIIDETAHILVTSAQEAGVTQLTLDVSEISTLRSQSSGTLTGTGGDDLLVHNGSGALHGQGGDDVLRDGVGTNQMTGGTGADVFVLIADQNHDTITDFQVGVDQLDLSMWANFNSDQQLSVRRSGGETTLTFGQETLAIRTSSGAYLTDTEIAAITPPSLARVQVELGAAPAVPGGQVNGTNGNDTLEGSVGNDTIDGFDGTDTLIIDLDRDTVLATELSNNQVRLTSTLGTDIVQNIEVFQFRDQTVDLDTLLGTAPAIDTLLTGTESDDTLEAGGGHDTVIGLQGNDRLVGNGGNDDMRGGVGFDTLLGGTGNDTLNGGEHADLLQGGTGHDFLIGENGYDILHGNDGNDTLLSGATPDRLYGGTGNDVLRAGSNFSLTVDGLWGEEGDDRLFGEGGFDFLDGGDGNDHMDGGHQADNLYGRSGNDTLVGDFGLDRLFGGADDDLALGGDGNDGLFGGQGNDTLRGGTGTDRFFGGPGNDQLHGDEGNDTIYAGAGFDTLVGGLGDDILQGDFNADRFVFEDGHGDDTITDFAATNIYEKIDLTAVSAITSLSDLMANHVRQSGANVIVDTGDGNSITLNAVSLADLDATDFLF